MKLLKLNKEERKAIKDKIPDCFKKTELHVLLDNGKLKAALPIVEDLNVIENLLNSFATGNRKKILQYFSKTDLSGLISDESWLYLSREDYKDLKEKIPSQETSKSGMFPGIILSELLPLSKLEIITERILNNIVNLREYTAFLLLPNIHIPSDYIKIDESFALVRATRDLMEDYSLSEEWEDFSWEKDKTYLSVNQPGYVGGLEPSLTAFTILNKLKTFLGLALIQGIFKIKETEWGYFSELKKPTPINLGIFRTTLDEGEYFFPFMRPHKLSESFTNIVRELSLAEESTKPSHDLQRLESEEEYLENKLSERLKGVLAADDGFAEIIKTAAEWYFESLCADSESFKLIQMTIAIEALLGEGREQLSERLADRCSFLLGESQRERQHIKKDFFKIYDIRSKTIHKGKIRLSEMEYPYLSRLKSILEDAIRKEIKHHSHI